MEKWKYKSLEWIHKVREEDYYETTNLSPNEIVERTRNITDNVVKSLGLKLVGHKEHIQTR